MIDKQLFDMKSIHQSYKKGTTPKDIVDEVYKRIEKIDDKGIFIYLAKKEEIYKQLESLGEMDLDQKPLWGIPFTVKDNIDVKDQPTTAACPAYEYHAKEDAFIVEVLKEAGAICIGKTNLDQFATGLVGLRTPYGTPKNAINKDIIPGGSSSGSAVAVSHQFFTFSLGTDTAGSGRIPAALNNIVGLKPSLGSLSKRGVVPACLTLDTVSIFTSNIDDAYNIYKIASKYDEKDPYSVKKPELTYKNLDDLTIAIPDSKSQIFFDDEIQKKSYLDTVDFIKEKGFKTIEIDMQPFFDVAELLYEGTWVAERYTVIEELMKKQSNDILEVTREVIQKAENFNACDTYRNIYKLNELKRKIKPILDMFDILCVPSMPKLTTLKDLEEEPIKANSRLGTYTNFVNLLDLSAIAFPTNKREDNFPGGVTIIGKAFKELLLAKFAKSIQKDMDLNYGNTSNKITLDDDLTFGESYDEIELAVVGAHMSGLALNKELLKLNSRLLYKSKTIPKYKLYKLAEGEPIRPGLIQDEDGVCIEIEVWAIPTKNMGAFEKKIPKPLSIGTLELEGDKQVKGFLCEPIGLKGAIDISSYGGFRAFLNSNKNKG